MLNWYCGPSFAAERDFQNSNEIRHVKVRINLISFTRQTFAWPRFWPIRGYNYRGDQPAGRNININFRILLLSKEEETVVSNVALINRRSCQDVSSLF
jgi:hypothetical protein